MELVGGVAVAIIMPIDLFIDTNTHTCKIN